MPANMEWEYSTFMIQGDITAGLNKLGKEGWEAWAIIGPQPDNSLAIAMKRRKSLIALANNLSRVQA